MAATNQPSMLTNLKSSLKSLSSKPRTRAPAPQKKLLNIGTQRPVETTYTSNEVDIPASFLTEPPSDAEPLTAQRIDFAQSPIPAYAGKYAVTIEHALSPSECKTLLALAEQSAVPSDDGHIWRPALVNMGNVGGRSFEVMASDYRRSDRIIWDAQEVVDRIFARCCVAPGVASDLAEVLRSRELTGGSERWTFARPNERMRFLRYRPGCFFDRHCDGAFEDSSKVPREKSFYTMHLYLSSASEDGTKGGETTFWSRDGKGRVDVEPVMGRVLIFQHQGLLHSGEMVTEGQKFTMRTDLMYRLEEDTKPS